MNSHTTYQHRRRQRARKSIKNKCKHDTTLFQEAESCDKLFALNILKIRRRSSIVILACLSFNNQYYCCLSNPPHSLLCCFATRNETFLLESGRRMRIWVMSQNIKFPRLLTFSVHNDVKVKPTSNSEDLVVHFSPAQRDFNIICLSLKSMYDLAEVSATAIRSLA
jgi:hypothetical protein